MIFEKEIVSQIREQADKIEKLGEITESILEYIYENQLFKLFIPKELGGKMLDLPSALKVIEEAAYIDGSFGWLISIGSGGGFFTPFIKPSISKDFFSERKAVIAGSGAPTGIAKKVEGGYLVSGQWKYCSGSTHATFFTANCMLEGTGEILSFIFTPEQVSILEDWTAFGLKGTASHTVKVESAFVDENHTFSIFKPHNVYDAPIYHFPFMNFAEVSFASVVIGLSKHFIDEAKELVKRNKEQWANHSMNRVDLVNQRIKDCEVIFLITVKEYEQCLNSIWNQFINGDKLSDQELEQLSYLCKESARLALYSVQSIFPFLGMGAVIESTTLNRIYRDIHTASQHIMLTPFYMIKE